MNKKVTIHLGGQGFEKEGLSFSETPECVINATIAPLTPFRKVLAIEMIMEDIVDDKKWISEAIEAIKTKIDGQ